MKEVNKYLNELSIRLVFDDDKPGRVYVLNTRKNYIYFIVDVDDKCLYINQDIFNQFPEREIKVFIQEIGIDFDIFPYFNDPSDIDDIAPSKQKYFELLMDIPLNILIDFSKYNNRVFLFYKDFNILEYNLKKDYLYNHYNKIWFKTQTEFDLNYYEQQNVIKKTLNKHFSELTTTPQANSRGNEQKQKIIRHFNRKNIIREYLNNLEVRLVFDDDKPGKIYVLNPEKSSIYFILDVDERCLYINRNIIDIFGNKEIKEFLSFDIEFDITIFPYNDDYSDIRDINPSTQRYFRLLMEEVRGIKMDFDHFNKSIFLFNENINILQYNIENNRLYNEKDIIWTRIKYRSKYYNIRRIITNTLERHFKNNTTDASGHMPSNAQVIESYFGNIIE